MMIVVVTSVPTSFRKEFSTKKVKKRKVRENLFTFKSSVDRPSIWPKMSKF